MQAFQKFAMAVVILLLLTVTSAFAQTDITATGAKLIPFLIDIFS